MTYALIALATTALLAAAYVGLAVACIQHARGKGTEHRKRLRPPGRPQRMRAPRTAFYKSPLARLCNYRDGR